MQQLASIDKQFNVLQKKKIEDLAAEFHSVDDFLKRRDEWLAQLEPSSLGTEEHREARAAWMQLKKDETDKIHGEAEKIRDWFEEEDDKLEKYLKANPPKKPEVKPAAPVQKPQEPKVEEQKVEPKPQSSPVQSQQKPPLVPTKEEKEIKRK